MVQGVPKCDTIEVSRTRYGTGRPGTNGFGTTTETFIDTISIPLAIAGSRLIAGWVPALSESAFLTNPGRFGPGSFRLGRFDRGRNDSWPKRPRAETRLVLSPYTYIGIGTG